MSKPLILVTNDDGINSKGIGVLVDIMSKIGEVIVVAPDSPQSGMGHAITVGNTLRLYQTRFFNEIVSYRCSGTPVDCVKLAKHHVLKSKKPDLLVSGINHGPNTSISVVYSGTMAAALEADRTEGVGSRRVTKYPGSFTWRSTARGSSRSASSMSASGRSRVAGPSWSTVARVSGACRPR